MDKTTHYLVRYQNGFILQNSRRTNLAYLGKKIALVLADEIEKLIDKGEKLQDSEKFVSISHDEYCKLIEIMIKSRHIVTTWEKHTNHETIEELMKSLAHQVRRYNEITTNKIKENIVSDIEKTPVPKNLKQDHIDFIKRKKSNGGDWRSGMSLYYAFPNLSKKAANEIVEYILAKEEI